MERDEARFHVADGVAVLHRAGHQSDASGVEERLAAVAGEEADVRHDNGIGARPDLGAPAARLEERPGPLEAAAPDDVDGMSDADYYADAFESVR